MISAQTLRVCREENRYPLCADAALRVRIMLYSREHRDDTGKMMELADDSPDPGLLGKSGTGLARSGAE
jgi:hypothetical protein